MTIKKKQEGKIVLTRMQKHLCCAFKNMAFIVSDSESFTSQKFLSQHFIKT